MLCAGLCVPVEQTIDIGPTRGAEESVGLNSKETGPEQLEISRLTLASGALTRSPRERDRDHS
jgi:hypothetical protein